MRIGDPFIDGIRRLERFDDRGQAFALWRCLPATHRLADLEWTGFRFNFVVEADLRRISEILERDLLAEERTWSLRSRADGLLPPEMVSVFVDTAGRQVVDADLLVILEQGYTKRGEGGWDVNLARDRQHLLFEAVDASRWPDACRSARATAEQIVLADSGRRRVWARRGQFAAQQWAAESRSDVESAHQGLVGEGLDLALATEAALEENLVWRKTPISN
jgi:ATP-dependent helicase HepA